MNTVIAGPCQHVSLEESLTIAEHCQKICDELGLDYIFKASFDKANRTYDASIRGIGLEGCAWDFDVIRRKYKLTTDYHECSQVSRLEADVYQIPALLSRQTDLLKTAASTGKIVNIKKGQFMSPQDIDGVLSKFEDKSKVWITERGTTFGYGKTIVDFEGINYMKDNYDVNLILDVTHSISERKYAFQMAQLAGVLDLGLFVEVYIDPDNAPSDGKRAISLKEFKKLLYLYKGKSTPE